MGEKRDDDVSETPPPDTDESATAAESGGVSSTDSDEAAETTAVSDDAVDSASGDDVVESTDSDAVDATPDGGTAAETATVTDDALNEDAPAVEDSVVEDGPPADEEMPLADHIEEMMRRLGIVFLVAGVAIAVVYPFSAEIINYLWATHIPAPLENRPRLYGPLEFILTKLKVAGLAGLVVGLPIFVYQTYRFMKPGLYRNERRYYLAAVPTSLVLGVFGVLFAHFLVLPFIFSYFTTYTAEAATIAFGLQETFNLILVMMAWMAIVFQIPLFIMLAIMMGLVTREWLEAKRLIFWAAFLGLAFIFSPDPTGMAPIIVTLTMIALYEGTLALLRWTGN